MNRVGGFGGGNMQAMMRQAQKMQQEALKAKEELDNSIFEGSACGGLVKVFLKGDFSFDAIKIDPSIVDADDVEMLEDMIVAAYNDAKLKVEDAKASKLGAFGGLI